MRGFHTNDTCYTLSIFYKSAHDASKYPSNAVIYFTLNPYIKYDSSVTYACIH